MRIYTPLCFFVLSFIFAIPVFAQKISGRVLNEGGKPASHVTVQFKDGSGRVMTNTNGNFIITVKTLPDTLFFSAAGYESYKVMVSEETIKDTNFAVVLLSTRSKTTMSEVATVRPTEKIATRNLSTTTP